RSDVIIASGGLGPTVDDITRDALASFLEVPMHLNEEVLEGIQTRFRSRGIKMPENNRRQAMVPEGGRILPNPNGTAPGIYLEARGRHVFLLPGPPFELEPMWEKYGLPLLGTSSPYRRKIFRIAMLPESRVDKMLEPMSAVLKSTQYTILAG